MSQSNFISVLQMMCCLSAFLDSCGGDNTNNFPRSLMFRKYEKTKKTNFRLEEKKILDTIMGQDVYDSRIRPAGINGTDKATFVYVNIFVRSFSKIDDVKMEYSFQITMRQQWNDVRLQYKDRLSERMAERIRYLTLTDASKVWMPDTFFRNEKIGAFHNILTPNLYIRVYPDGDVLYSIRISITCACPMHLSLFPLDQQTCTLDIASYGWAKDDLVYVWKDASPVQLANNLSLPGGFQLGAFGSEYCDVVTTTGEYSCLRVKLLFARQLSFFLVTVYVPCSMTVSVSWMSFWLDHKAVPARVALGVTTLLAMSTTQASIQNSLPPVAYTKAIDVWSGVCVVFVFSALLEYALVNYASRSDAQRSVKQKERKKLELERQVFSGDHFSDEGGFPTSLDPLMRRVEGSHIIPPAAVIHHRLPGRKSNKLFLWFKNFEFQAKKIDVFSRVFFPFVFAVFNIWYWSYYLSRSGENNTI